jgi:hypothetical protein
MTPEEREKSIAVLQKAVIIANRQGKQMLSECNNSAAVSATAAAIMLSTFCAAAGMSMHDAVGLFMSVHKQTEAMTGEQA